MSLQRLTRVNRSVLVVLFSLFGRLVVLSIFLPLSRPKENCPISETLQFIFVDLNFLSSFFLTIGHSLIFRLDKKKIKRLNKNQIIRYLSRVNFFWPKRLTNCSVNFSFFWSVKRKLSRLRDWSILSSTLLIFCLLQTPE